MKSVSHRSETRQSIALALVFCAILLFGIFLGGHSSWMPSGLKSFFVSQSQPQQRLQAVLKLLNREYYRKVDDQALTDTGLTAMVASLDDPYSHYYTPKLYQEFENETAAQVAGIGVYLTGTVIHDGLRIDSVIAHSPAAKGGLRSGDLIVKVGDHLVKTIGADGAEALIKGTPGSQVTLAIKRRIRTFEVTLTRALVTFPVVGSRLITYRGRKLGYIDFTQFTENSGAELRQNVERMLKAGAQGLILDLRNNPGGLLEEAVASASVFIPSGVIVSTRGRSQPTVYYKALGHAISRSVPLTVLVDRDTASSAEIVTAALQDYKRATVIGTHTYGKGVFQQIFPLSDGGALDITVGEFYTPNGRNLGGSGVTAERTVNRGAGVTPNIYVADNPDTASPQVLLKAEQVLAAKLGK